MRSNLDLLDRIGQILPAKARRRIAKRLRYLADDIDRDGAVRMMGSTSFTFERGVGMVFRSDGRGCPIAYFGDQYERAHDEAGPRDPDRRNVLAWLPLFSETGPSRNGEGLPAFARAWQR